MNDKTKIVNIPVEDLIPHPRNPRKDLGDLTELADSIRAQGIFQNLTVVPKMPEDGGCWLGEYTIIIGHRRAAAAKLAGLTELPCVVVEMTEQEQLETMMVENMQRSDLTRIEEAEGFQLMLDLGQSVEDVAQKTGFSPTTVRSRVSLLKLDRKALKKAEERGGTLQDYADVNGIADPNLRTKVLNTVGTANFRDELRKAKQQEELQAFLREVHEQLKKADWCKKKTTEDCGAQGSWEYAYAYDKYHMDEGFYVPEDIGDREYVYNVHDDGSITLYRKKVVQEDPKEAHRKALKQEMDSLVKELQALSKGHQALRADFVKSFRQEKRYAEEILALNLDMLKDTMERGWIYTYEVHAKDVAKFLGIEMDEHDCMKKDAWDRIVIARPEYITLCVAYLLAEGNFGLSYTRTVWDAMTGKMPEFQENDRLDLLYENLIDMGYEMCTEEEQMMDGKHPLYVQAKRIRQELEELDKDEKDG